MKKILIMAVCLCLIAAFSGCNENSREKESVKKANKQSEAKKGRSPETNSKQSGKAEFDFKKKTVRLNSGYDMPIMGLGTYSLDHKTCVNSVVSELKSGGRLIDTAYMYDNEAAVGEGIKQSGVPREEVFVTTKIYPSQFDEPEKAIDEALERLDVDYIDLMLLHHPGDGDVKAYKAMEKATKEGKIRSMGLSNWYIKELKDFLPKVTVTPAVVQNEIHPYYQESDVVVIPGSSNPDHIKENLDLFGFELSDEEMNKIKKLERNEKHEWY